MADDPTPAPLPDPVRERIVQHCETSLWAIDGTGAYYFALADVQRGKITAPDDLTKLPAASLEEGDEAPTQDTNLLLTHVLPLGIEVWLRSGKDDPPLQTLANRMLADVERALTADPTRGGLAKRTTPVGTSGVQDAAPGVLTSVLANFEIEYYTRQGDPASTG